MIVKDEEKLLKDCLDSIKSLVSEIIIVDTGSKDKTIEIAKEFTNKIYSFKWINDFSAARNFSISKATQPWILILDADETISPEDINKIRELIKDDSVTAYTLIQRNYTNDVSLPGLIPIKNQKPSKGYCNNPLTRLFKNDKRIKFKNRIHEVVEPSIKEIEGKIVKTDVIIHHYGWLKDETLMNLKRDQYLDLALEQIKETPKDPKPYYEAARVYRTKNDFEKTEYFLKKVISLDITYPNAYLNLGECYLARGMFSKAKEVYKEALASDPDNENIMINLAVIYSRENEFDKARLLFEKVIKINPLNVPAYDNSIAIHIQEKDFEKALDYARKGLKNTGLHKFDDAMRIIKRNIKN